MATHRVRRGKVVEIPAEWQNRIPTHNTMARRKRIAEQKVLDRKKRVRREQQIHYEFNMGD